MIQASSCGETCLGGWWEVWGGWGWGGCCFSPLVAVPFFRMVSAGWMFGLGPLRGGCTLLQPAFLGFFLASLCVGCQGHPRAVPWCMAIRHELMSYQHPSSSDMLLYTHTCIHSHKPTHSHTHRHVQMHRHTLTHVYILTQLLP